MNYFIIENGQQVGPLTIDQLRSKGITGGTNVWHEGMAQWGKAKDIPEIASILQLGTTPAVGIGSSTFYIYAILVLLIGLTTHFSFKMNSASSAMTDDPTMKMMPTMMTIMIIVTSIFMPSGLGIYWVTSNLFTIVQNYLVKRSKANGKA